MQKNDSQDEARIKAFLELLNLLRPTNSQIQRELIFTNDKTYLLNIKEGGLEYLKKMYIKIYYL